MRETTAVRWKCDRVNLAIDHGPCTWSPDGSRLATMLVSTGAARIAIIDMRGIEPVHVFGTAKSVGCAGGPSWEPAQTIAYVDATAHSIRTLNPESGAIELIVADTTLSMFRPVVSADGNAFAYYVQSEIGDRIGIWVRTSPRGDFRWLSAAYATPVSWTPGNKSLLVRFGVSRDIVVIYLDGRTRVVAKAQAQDAWCEPIGTVPKEGFICTTMVSVSDAWLLELSKC